MKSSARRAALSCALLATTAFCGLAARPAMAQSSAPAYRNLDANGVDLTHGGFHLSFLEGSIGSGEAELALVRHVNGHQWDRIEFQRYISGSTVTIWVTLGLESETFTSTGAGFSSNKANGGTLGYGGGGYVYRASDGTQIRFTDPTQHQMGGETNFCQIYQPQPNCRLVPESIVSPDGKSIQFTWDVAPRCKNEFNPDNTLDCEYFWRLGRVENSFGQQIAFSYASDDGGGHYDTQPAASWKQRTKSDFINTAVGTAPQASVTYAYPSAGVTDVTDPAGRTWRFTQSTAGTGMSIRRPGAASDTTTVAYGTGTIAVTRDGVSTNYARTVSGSTATMTVTNALNQTTTVVSNMTVGRPTAITDPLGRTTNLAYDSFGRLTRTTAPEGNYVEHSYDANGNVTQSQFVPKPGSGQATLTTAATFAASCTSNPSCNKPLTTTDARGQTTNYSYDPTHGGLTAVTLPAAPDGKRPETRYSYTQTNGEYQLTGIAACQTQTSCAGTVDEVKVALAYDAFGNTTGVTAANGTGALSASQAMTYDAKGDLLTVDGPLSGTTDTIRYRYNAARQRIGSVSPDPDGGGPLKHRAVRTTYDATTGLPTKTERGTVNGQSDGDWSAFAAAEAAETGYDSHARAVTRKLTAGGATHALSQMSYDALGRVECNALRMNPAAYGALPASACSLGTEGSHGPDRISKATFDVAGQQTKLQTAFGTAAQADEWTATFRNNGALETVSDGEGNKTTYEYDGHDRLVKTRFPSVVKGMGLSSTTDYEGLAYDNGGNVTQRRLRDGQLINLSYDNLGRLSAKDLPGGEPDVSYTYDLLGRMLSASQTGSSLSFGYDALGRNTSQTGPIGSASFSFDAAGRRTQMNYGGGLSIDYDHLVTGEVTRIRENGATSGVGVLASYTYDDLGRRTSLTRGNGTAKSYGYDAASRLASMGEDLAGTGADLTLGFTYNPASQIATNTRSNDSYAWSAHYNLTRNYTANGLNQYTASGSVSPTYDGRGNLTSAGNTTYGYSSENMLTSASGGIALAYDPMLRLQQTSGGAAGTTKFGYDGKALIAEYDGANTLLRRYVHGPGSDEPVVWYEGSGTADRRWLHADERGSVIAVSNSSGATIATNAYDEYGIPKSGNSGRFQYTGQTWLPELGMYHYKARIYSPTLGRFLQTDPIGFGDGMNMYAYVGGDPVNLVDPTGLDGTRAGEDCGTEDDPCEATVNGTIIKITGNRGALARSGSGIARGNGGRRPGATPPQPARKEPTKPEPKDDPDCKIAKTEEGSVVYEATSVAIIVGGGIVGSRGTFVNVRTGTTGSFWSIGGGAGADIGISQGVGTSTSVASLGGGGASGSASAGIASFSGNASLGKNSITPDGSSAGIGLGVLRLGISGTLSGTKLYGCKVPGR